MDNGAEVFFVFNNPAEVLSRHIERSRRAIADARVTKLDLSCGPMAVAGSTRMQATTSELLVVGAALETALAETLRARLDGPSMAALGVTTRRPADYSQQFALILSDLASPRSVAAIATMTQHEEDLYRHHGLVTYVADECLLDIFTDTTERSPTFMLPRFRACNDPISPPPWAFVKHARLTTAEAWRQVLRREPRCLTWDAEIYRRLDAPAKIRDNPPRLSADEMRRFAIGNEDDRSRYGVAENTAVLVAVGKEVERLAAHDDPLRVGFETLSRPFCHRAVLAVGRSVAATTWPRPSGTCRSASATRRWGFGTGYRSSWCSILYRPRPWRAWAGSPATGWPTSSRPTRS